MKKIITEAREAASLFVRALPNVLVDLLRCWAILLVPALLVLITVGTGQGLNATFVAASSAEVFGEGYHAYAAQAVTTVLATIAAVAVLTPRDGQPKMNDFADYHVSGLVGLLAGSLPVIVLQQTDAFANEAPQGVAVFLIIGSLAPPVWLIFARDFLPGPWNFAAAKSLFFSHSPLLVSMLCVSALLAFLGVRALFTFIAAEIILVCFDLWLWRNDQFRSVPYMSAAFVAAIAIVGAALVAACPAELGLSIGSYGVLLVSLNFWLAVGCLIFLGLRALYVWFVESENIPKGIQTAARTVSPIIPPLVVLAIVVRLFIGPFDLREVRLLADAPDSPPAAGIGAQATSWLTARRSQIEASDACYPVFVVNADGGGVRAAWWTASILGALRDRQAEFPAHVFAISGVSGGSLGAAVFAARTAHSPTHGSECENLSWRNCADRVLARDLLAPAIGSMVISDAFRSILQWGDLPDRGSALEQAFERAWASATGLSTFGEPFSRLWAKDNATQVPLLLFNATEAPTSRRLVLGPVPLFPADAERGDIGALLDKRSVRLSTAVLLSARFPWVSPAGWLPADKKGLGTAIVDGGFVDNSGSASAADAIAALQEAAVKLNMPKVLPIALMIANAPVSPHQTSVVPGPGSRSTFAATTIGSIVAPVMTLDQLRQFATARAKREYRARVIAAKGLVLDGFDLRDDGRTYPLGWMLAPQTRLDMGAQIDKFVSNPSSHFSKAADLVRQCARN